MNEPDSNTHYENGDVPDPTADEPDEFEQLSELADAGELTEERLQETLNSYAKAFQEEFANSVAKSPEDVEVYTRDFFKKNVHSAAAQIVHLSNNAYSESVRLRAAQMVVSEALKDSRADGDPIRDLLNELSKNDSPAAPPISPTDITGKY